MRLNISLLQLLMLNAVLVLIPTSKASSSTTGRAFQSIECQQYEADRSASCGSGTENCPPAETSYMTNSGFPAGEGIYTLPLSSVNCTTADVSTNHPCSSYSQLIGLRSDNSGYCCDRDGYTYVRNHA